MATKAGSKTIEQRLESEIIVRRWIDERNRKMLSDIARDIAIISYALLGWIVGSFLWAVFGR